MVGFNFAPRGWMFCNGQLLPISQYTAVFSLLGTQYGGDGQTNFALPDLRGRVPLHYVQGPGLSAYSIGQTGGVEAVALNASQIPAHTHNVRTSKDEQTTNRPDNAYPTVGGIYASNPDGTAPMAPSTSVGSNQSHENRQPFLAVNFVIAVEGIFPSRN